MTELNSNRFCGSCGAALQGGVAYCPSCGAAVSSVSRSSATRPATNQQLDWREQRREMRAERRSGPGLHVGGLIVAAILVVAGLAIFLPSLPWYLFWGTILIVIGLLVAYTWSTRGSRYGSKSKQQSQ